jgi:glycosyltransferase involved in cell wall biosynthesis
LTTADPWQNQEAESVTRGEDQALASNPLISPLLQFRGYVSYASIPSLYAECDLFVFPSLVESFGHPLVEAMASKLPILASDIPVCREICGEAALYFNPFDAQDLADKMLRLRHDSSATAVGRSGRKRAVHFDWNDHVRRLIELIEEVGANA